MPPIEAYFVQQAGFLKSRERYEYFRLVRDGIGRHWPIETLARWCGRKLRSRSWNPEVAWRSAESEVKSAERGIFSAVILCEKRYPKLLQTLYDPPFLLYYRGRIETLSKAAVAVVGTRIPAGNAASASWRIGFDLGQLSIPVVSGLALGIDSFAHAGNHRAGCGSVAVLGCGIDAVYPPANRQLAVELLQRGGVILSEYPPGTPPAPFRFPERNRIVSGLATVTVVVQAPLKSGALITADFALEQGREVVVMKTGLRGERGGGGAALAQSGAPVIESCNELLPLIRRTDNWKSILYERE